MANSLGTVMLIDAYGPLQGEREREQGQLLSCKALRELFGGRRLSIYSPVEPTSGAVFKVLRRR